MDLGDALPVTQKRIPRNDRIGNRLFSKFNNLINNLLNEPDFTRNFRSKRLFGAEYIAIEGYDHIKKFKNEAVAVLLILLAVGGITLSEHGCDLFVSSAQAGDDPAMRELWEVHPEFESIRPQVIAVVPIDNLSYEKEMEEYLYQEVHNRLVAKGYRRIAMDRVYSVMAKLGIQTPGMLRGISIERLCEKLGSQGIIFGQIDQSASIHAGLYDAVVVSCSLRMVHCKSGETIWQASQWRTAHRQWQLDPINMLINFSHHKNESRKDRLAWLVQEMFKTLPEGPVKIETDNLLQKAMEINVQE